MTKGAIAMKQIKEDELKRKSNEKIEANKLADKAKQRKWESGENRKNRIKDYITSGFKAIKFPKFNDPAWYKRFIPDLDRFTNIPTYQRLGAEPFTKDGFVASSFTGSKHNWALPGIMVIPYIPTTGPQNQAISVAERYPINQALNRTKEQVLKSNSRSNVNWEGADIGLNIFCTSSIVTAITEIKRALLIYQTYRGDNAYLAQVYLRALQVDYTDLVTNVAEYRKRLKLVVEKFNASVVAPADLSIYARNAYLAANVFKDRKGELKQAYVFKCMHFHRLNPAGDGTLITAHTNNQQYTLDAMFSMVDAMIESITANPDYVEMYADLRSSIKNLLKLDGNVEADEVIEFNDDDLNREQIHNLKLLPRLNIGAGGSITIDTNDWILNINSAGYLYQGNANGTTRRRIQYSTTGFSSDQVNAAIMCLENLYHPTLGLKYTIFDMDKDEINGDDILDITRGNFTANAGTTGSTVTLSILGCGTELFTCCYMWRWDQQTNTYGFTEEYGYMISDYAYRSGVNYEIVSMYTKFDWAPMAYHICINATTDLPVSYSNIILESASLFDTNHTFSISYQDLDKINEACVLSEYFLVTDQFKM